MTPKYQLTSSNVFTRVCLRKIHEICQITFLYSCSWLSTIKVGTWKLHTHSSENNMFLTKTALIETNASYQDGLKLICIQ